MYTAQKVIPGRKRYITKFIPFQPLNKMTYMYCLSHLAEWLSTSVFNDTEQSPRVYTALIALLMCFPPNNEEAWLVSLDRGKTSVTDLAVNYSTAMYILQKFCLREQIIFNTGNLPLLDVKVTKQKKLPLLMDADVEVLLTDSIKFDNDAALNQQIPLRFSRLDASLEKKKETPFKLSEIVDTQPPDTCDQIIRIIISKIRRSHIEIYVSGTLCLPEIYPTHRTTILLFFIGFLEAKIQDKEPVLLQMSDAYQDASFLLAVAGEIKMRSRLEECFRSGFISFEEVEEQCSSSSTSSEYYCETCSEVDDSSSRYYNSDDEETSISSDDDSQTDSESRGRSREISLGLSKTREESSNTRISPKQKGSGDESCTVPASEIDNLRCDSWPESDEKNLEMSRSLQISMQKYRELVKKIENGNIRKEENEGLRKTLENMNKRCDSPASETENIRCDSWPESDEKNLEMRRSLQISMQKYRELVKKIENGNMRKEENEGQRKTFENMNKSCDSQPRENKCPGSIYFCDFREKCSETNRNSFPHNIASKKTDILAANDEIQATLSSNSEIGDLKCESHPESEFKCKNNDHLEESGTISPVPNIGKGEAEMHDVVTINTDECESDDEFIEI